MDLLEELIGAPTSLGSRRPRVRPYLPFTEPPLRGPYFRAMRAGRSNFSIANALAYRAFRPVSRALPLRASGLSKVEDRRFWRPSDVSLDLSGRQVSPTDVSPVVNRDRWEWPKRFVDPPVRDPFTGRQKVRWIPGVMTQLANGPWWYGFQNPSKIVICVKRKIRREVMHALGLSGKVGQKSPHFTSYSRVRC